MEFCSYVYFSPLQLINLEGLLVVVNNWFKITATDVGFPEMFTIEISPHQNKRGFNGSNLKLLLNK